MLNGVYLDSEKLVGGTPLIEVPALRVAGGARVVGKHEGYNPGGSVKDRICLNMILEAEKSGALQPGGTIVEPTSGNTGIGLAMVAAFRGYKCVLTMPDTMSMERRTILQAYGAHLELTPGADGMKGAIALAEQIAGEREGAFMPQQFKNPANPAIHYKTTGPEIWRDTQGQVTAFVAGVGTGGTITGAGRFLREVKQGITLVAVEPAESPVLSGGEPGSHRIQGIGAGFVPDVLDTEVYDEVRQVESEKALDTMRRLAQEEGLFVGISAAANLLAASEVAAERGAEETVVTIICDGGEKYLSLW